MITTLPSQPPPGTSPYIQDWYPPPDDTPRRGQIPSAGEYGDMVYEEAPDDDAHENLDNYIHAELVLEVGGEPVCGRVMKRAVNADGTKKGRHTRTQCLTHVPIWRKCLSGGNGRRISERIHCQHYC